MQLNDSNHLNFWSNWRWRSAFFSLILQLIFLSTLLGQTPSEIVAVVKAGEATPEGGAFASAILDAGYSNVPIIGSAVLNNNGRIAFLGQISGGRATMGPFGPRVNYSGLFSTVGGITTTASLSGDSIESLQSPGVDAGPCFLESFLIGTTAEAMDFNDQGDAVVHAFAEGNCSLRESDPVRKGFGLFLIRSGSRDPEVVAIEKDPAPGGGQFRKFFASPVLNNDGQVLFSASIASQSDYEMEKALFLRSGDELIRVAVQGEESRGGKSFSGNFTPYAMNDKGEAVCRAGLLDSRMRETASGIFRREPGTGLVQLIATGDPAPGGGVFSDFSISPGSLSLNNKGQILFVANVIRGGRLATLAGVFCCDLSSGRVVRVQLPGPFASNFNDASEVVGVSASGDGFDLFGIQEDGNVIRRRKVVDFNEVPSMGGMFSRLGRFGLNNAGTVLFHAEVEKDGKNIQVLLQNSESHDHLAKFQTEKALDRKDAPDLGCNETVLNRFMRTILRLRT